MKQDILEPIPKRLTDTKRKILEECKATTKRIDDIHKKFPMITHPSAAEAS